MPDQVHAGSNVARAINRNESCFTAYAIVAPSARSIVAELETQEAIMQKTIRTGAIALALLGSAGFLAQTGSAQTPGGAPSPAQQRMNQDTPKQQQRMGQDASKDTQRVRLTSAQRTAILKAVSADKERVKAPANFKAAVGAQVPSTVELRDLPDTVVADAPEIRNYKYTMVQNQVVLVDPSTMRVVEIIRR
jgi:hypothetical protein